MRVLTPDEITKRDQFLHDVLCTAIEGGIDYWAVARNIVRGGKEGMDYHSFEVRDREHSGPSVHTAIETQWRTINAAKLDEAILKILHGDSDVGSEVASQFIGYPFDIDMTNHDASGADCAVQIAAFGSLVFG